jgi:hypothetical protein
MRQQNRFLLNFFSSDEGTLSLVIGSNALPLPIATPAKIARVAMKYQVTIKEDDRRWFVSTLGTEALGESFRQLSFGLLQSFEMSFCASPPQVPLCRFRSPLAARQVSLSASRVGSLQGQKVR